MPVRPRSSPPAGSPTAPAPLRATPVPKGAPPAVRSFRALELDYWQETFERFPVSGAWVGVDRLWGELGGASAATWRAQIALARRTLEALQQLPVHDFEGGVALDRRTLRAHLLTELLKLEELETWRINPQIHLDNVAESIHGILVRKSDRLKAATPWIVSRLKAIPAHLEEGFRCLRAPVPLWRDLARQAAPGVVSLFRSLPEPLAATGAIAREEIDGLVEAACRAVERYSARLERIETGPARGYALGVDRFERLMRLRLGLDWSAGEAVASALGLMEHIGADLKAEAKRFHPRKPAHEILAEARAGWEPGRPLLDLYRDRTFVIRDRFRAAEAMTFPDGERLVVREVPDFMKHQFPTAAYTAPGALDPDQTGIFWVNDMSLAARGEAARRREVEQHFGLDLTCAHEAYPGHHLQFIRQHRVEGLSRRLADHAIYYEGWTLWCEQMAIDLGVCDGPHARLQQLHDALWRACRIVIDCGLHAGAMDFSGACRLLEREVGFTRARAKGDVNWYTSSPTVPMSYLLGKMELLRLKRRRVDAEGKTLREFNDWVLGFGAIPWSWIEASGL